MAKNAGQTVAALLAKAPSPPARIQQPSGIAAESPTSKPEPERAADPEQTPETAAASVAPAIPAARPAAQRRSRKLADPASSPAAESKAPPTLRLAQPTAEALRAAWLQDKRDRVLLTYQDFAGEVITAGLRAGHRATAVDDKSASTAGSPVPRTLRLAQPTAEALRTAWLQDKRDRVLLTYQDFASEVITAGLRQARQHTAQQ